MKKIEITVSLPEDENETVLVFYPSISGEQSTTANCERHQDGPRWYDYRGQEINTNHYQLTHWAKIE